MGSLPDFLLARTGEAELAGAMSEVDATQQRRDIVRHSESHICDERRRNDPNEIVDTFDDPDWCRWLRDLGARYVDHPAYEDRWRPWDDPHWDDLDG